MKLWHRRINLDTIRDADWPKVPDGTVVRFKKQFENSCKWYTYVVVKVNGKWYMSGVRATQRGREWSELVTWMESAGGHISDMDVAVTWRRINSRE